MLVDMMHRKQIVPSEKYSAKKNLIKNYFIINF
jgi:hypothetical protein